jgi:hypothetical protein
MKFRLWHGIYVFALLLCVGISLRLVSSLNGREPALRHQHVQAFAVSDDKTLQGDIADRSSDEFRGMVGPVAHFSWASPPIRYPHLLLVLSIQAPISLMMCLVHTLYASSAI